MAIVTLKIDDRTAVGKQILSMVRDNPSKALQIVPTEKSVAKKEIDESDPNIIATREECKRMRNELRRKFNEKSEVKVKYLV